MEERDFLTYEKKCPLLLQKIEELTLHILQQEEKIKQQELRIKILENQQ